MDESIRILAHVPLAVYIGTAIAERYALLVWPREEDRTVRAKGLWRFLFGDVHEAPTLERAACVVSLFVCGTALPFVNPDWIGRRPGSLPAEIAVLFLLYLLGFCGLKIWTWLFKRSCRNEWVWRAPYLCDDIYITGIHLVRIATVLLPLFVAGLAANAPAIPFGDRQELQSPGDDRTDNSGKRGEDDGEFRDLSRTSTELLFPFQGRVALAIQGGAQVRFPALGGAPALLGVELFAAGVREPEDATRVRIFPSFTVVNVNRSEAFGYKIGLESGRVSVDAAQGLRILAQRFHPFKDFVVHAGEV